MPLLPLIDYEDAAPEVRAVYDDIMQTRGSNWINNFWKVLANHPETLARVWEDVKNVMKPGALDPLVKEMIYVAVSATNNCEYCIHSHTAGARAKGMTDEMFAELMAVTGLATGSSRLGVLSIAVVLVIGGVLLGFVRESTPATAVATSGMERE